MVTGVINFVTTIMSTNPTVQSPSLIEHMADVTDEVEAVSSPIPLHNTPLFRDKTIKFYNSSSSTKALSPGILSSPHLPGSPSSYVPVCTFFLDLFIISRPLEKTLQKIRHSSNF